MTTGKPAPSQGWLWTWPRLACIGLTLVTGVGMIAFALRFLGVLERCGVVAPIVRGVAVGCPIVIGTAILGFGLALLRTGRNWPPVADAAGAGRGMALRLSLFIVPLMAVTQMGAARLGHQAQSTWSTFLLAGLLPMVPLTVIGFGVATLGATQSYFFRRRPRRRMRTLPPTS